MRIRHVRASEADRLREIRLRSLATDPSAYGSTYAREVDRPDSWWEDGARRSETGELGRTYVVTDDEDTWLGLALVRPDDEAPGDAVINAMWVAPEARRRGASSALCEACVAWATARDFPAINLSAKLGNTAAIEAYKRAGFDPVRVDDDELVLTRRLDG